MIIGVSDGQIMAQALSGLFAESYRNFEFHKAPFLDITNVPNDLCALADIVICSEVLEHVSRPVEPAFEGLHKMLRNQGRLVMSVPHKSGDVSHLEHFPVLTDVRLDRASGVLHGKLINTGEDVSFKNLVFHGGAGETLEHRVFSEKSLVSYLEKAGFTKIRKTRNHRLLGIHFEPWSRVWVARKTT